MKIGEGESGSVEATCAGCETVILWSELGAGEADWPEFPCSSGCSWGGRHSREVRMVPT